VAKDTLPSASTLAFSVARFTDAVVTPGTFSSAFSTRATQEAQVMPSTCSSTRCVGTS
jgi:hypothetical protein